PSPGGPSTRGSPGPPLVVPRGRRPVRAGWGAAPLSFFSVLFFGAASDVIASNFHLSVNAVLWTFRIAVFVLPPIVATFVYRLCKELSARDDVPTLSRVGFGEIAGQLFRGSHVR